MIRRARLEGRDHYVVPTVMILNGSWAGSRGPIHYPAPVLRASARLWNGKPVVVYHPDMRSGGYADHPDVYDRQKVGVLFHTRYDGRRLTAEAWLDEERTLRVDGRVLEAVKVRRVLNVSTGMEVRVDRASVARKIVPDHLAILPDRPGACSVDDGAGLCRNRSEGADGAFALFLDAPVIDFSGRR